MLVKLSWSASLGLEASAPYAAFGMHLDLTWWADDDDDEDDDYDADDDDDGVSQCMSLFRARRNNL